MSSTENNTQKNASKEARPNWFRRFWHAVWKWMKSGKEASLQGTHVRSIVALSLLCALLFALCIRFAFLQLVDPYNYADSAADQYTYETTVEAKRGSILASDGTTKLAYSGTTYTVFISPSDIYQTAEDEASESGTEIDDTSAIRMIADGLASCLEDVSAEEIIQKYNALGTSKSQRKYLVIKKDISDSEEEAVQKFIDDNDLSRQIAFEENEKRIYPYDSLAAQVLGFVGTDDSGLMGIEETYNEYLSGVDGKIVRARDANGNELAYNYEVYVDAEDGLNLVTTIDWEIQTTVEKYLKETYEEFNPEGRVSCIVMDVDTGEILAYAIYPSFDLNNPGTLSEEYQKKLQAYEGEDVEQYETELLYEMWSNTIASQTYEPGSTFKVITASIALETGKVDTKQTFNCGRSIHIADQTIHCWAKFDHGYQTLSEALVNSCNPAFSQIGLLIGEETFAKYFEEFGYTEKTGSDIQGEANSIYYATTGTEFRDINLAVYSFGQTFKVTMLQHIAALSAVANGGNLVTPHIGKYLMDNQGNIVKTFDTSTKRQVISESVCDEIMSMLVNSTKNACVNGYNVISKTGTSEKRDTEEDDYISSCVTFAPAEDPQIAILVTVDTPDTSIAYYGSSVAAPAVGNILSEVLPYLGIEPSETSGVQTVRVKDYRGESVESARSEIEALGLTCIVKGDGQNVNTQSPAADSTIVVNGTVVLYTGDAKAEETVTVPKVEGSTPEAAMKSLLAKGLNVKLEGVYSEDTSGCYVDSQSIASGTKVAPGTVITISCRYKAVND